jgi:hypothetical protein
VLYAIHEQWYLEVSSSAKEKDKEARNNANNATTPTAGRETGDNMPVAITSHQH